MDKGPLGVCLVASHHCSWAGTAMCVLVLPFLQRNSCRAPSCTCFTSSHLLRRGEGWDLSYEFTGRRMTWHYCAVLSHSVVSNSFPPPRTVVLQAPLSMGILQARMLVWVAMPSSRVSSQPMDQTQVSHIAGRFFTIWVTREAHIILHQDPRTACTSPRYLLVVDLEGAIRCALACIPWEEVTMLHV